VFSVTFSLGPSIVDLCPETSRVSPGLYIPCFQISSLLHAPRLSRILTFPEFLLGSKHSDIGSKSVLSRGLHKYLTFLVSVLVPPSPFPTSSVLPRDGFGITSARHPGGAVPYVAVV